MYKPCILRPISYVMNIGPGNRCVLYCVYQNNVVDIYKYNDIQQNKLQLRNLSLRDGGRLRYLRGVSPFRYLRRLLGVRSLRSLGFLRFFWLHLCNLCNRRSQKSQDGGFKLKVIIQPPREAVQKR